MPSRLEIQFAVDGSQSVSKFVVAEGGYVDLHNDAIAKLDLTFPETSPLCLGGQPQFAIDLDAGKRESYQVCPGAAGQTFKYTVTVAGSQADESYILVESPVWTPEVPSIDTNPAIKFERLLSGDSLFMLAAGILLGIGLSMLSGRNRPRP